MRPRRMPVALCLLIALALVAAACGGDDDATGVSGGAGDEPAAADGGAAPDDSAANDDGGPGGEPLVELMGSEYGEILASDGFTLYLFTPDGPGESTCFDSCAALWPPLEHDTALDVGPGLDAERFALIDRGDGTMQVTYDDRPLYFYAPDSPGTTDGQGLNGVWFVVDVDGGPVTATSGGRGGIGY